MQKDIKIEERGVVETAHRVKLIIGQVFRYAIATDRAESDPTVALRGALQTRKEVHYGMIAEPAQVSGLIRAGYFSLPLSGCAVRAHVLSPNLLHPREICHTEWCEIDLDRQEWWIPAEKLKMKRDHIVQLATQTLKLPGGTAGLTETGEWLFLRPARWAPHE